MKLSTMTVALLLLTSHLFSSWNTPPGGWDDIKFGLVNDNSEYSNRRIQEAVVNRGIQIDYRYVYLNGGVDKNNNRISWSFNEYQNYTLDSKDKVGCEAAYVVYMLQEEGGAQALKSVASDITKMKQFFESLQIVAEYAAGKKSTWVIEPDTWGYILQGNQSDTGSAFLENTAHLNDLGIAHLAGFDNKISNIPQAIIAHIKHYAPDAYAGILMSFWSVDANLKVDPQYQVDGAIGFADWHLQAVEYSAGVNLAFAQKLLPRSDYSKGDFIGVEKNGYDAGWWKTNGDKGDYYYWNDDQMRKWLRWSEILAKGLDLPLLGWQISIGHEGLPNLGSANSTNEIGNGQYEDTFFPFFFAHPEEFIDIGFIGFLVGKGLADGTDFTNSTDPLDAGKGDLGWFLDNLQEFDKGRPWLLGGMKQYTITTASEGNGTVSPEGTIRVDSAGTLKLTCTPDEWHVVDSVVIDGENKGSNSTITLSNVISPHSVTVFFGKDPTAPELVAISETHGSNGTISPSGTLSLLKGSDTTVVISPSNGYVVSQCSLNNTDYGAVTQISFKNLQKDHSIAVEFEQSPNAVKAWDPSGSYPNQDTVSHNASLWTNSWYANAGEEPGVNSVWKNIGSGTSGTDTLITVQLEYRSGTNSSDTIIAVTTTVIGSDTSTNTRTEIIDNSTPLEVVYSTPNMSIDRSIKAITVASPGVYAIGIYDIRGRLLFSHKLEAKSIGTHVIPFDSSIYGKSILFISVTTPSTQFIEKRITQ